MKRVLVSYKESEIKEHKESCELVEEMLKKHNSKYEFIKAKELIKRISGFDFVITLGGDGTVFRTAYYIIDNTPLFAVNSAPKQSKENFEKGYSSGSITSAEPSNLEETMERIYKKDYEILEATRLKAYLNNKLIEPSLNEIVILTGRPISHGCLSYKIIFKGKEEIQQSSGIVAATGIGSTGIYKNICKNVKRGFPRNSNYFKFGIIGPREDYNLIKGKVRKRDSLCIELPEKEKGLVTLDGFKDYVFSSNSKLYVRLSDKPLRIIIFD